MKWRVRLAARADADLHDILKSTADTFGPAQAEAYQALLTNALASLTAGPDIRGSVAREDVASGIRTLHVDRARRRARHVVVFRERERGLIEVIRILHEVMDLPRHVGE